MKATIPYIEQKFEEFNQLMFEGKLPKIPVVLSNAKTFVGMCVYKKRRRFWGRTEKYDFKLKINTRVDLPEQELEDTIIHEMIHYYIGVNQLEDTSAHGQLFRQMMNTINERYGRHITVSFKGTKEQKEQFYDHTPHYHVVAVLRLSNGRFGIKVLPRIRQRIQHYCSGVTRNPDVVSVELYLTNNPYFNRYPNSSALNAQYIDKDVLAENIKGAEKLQIIL